MSNCGCGHGGCTTSMVAKWLLVVGGLNWGLVGIGILMGAEWNLVNMLLGAWPVLEAVVYVLVGVAALMSIFHCRCAKCTTACATCTTHTAGQGMQ